MRGRGSVSNAIADRRALFPRVQYLILNRQKREWRQHRRVEGLVHHPPDPGTPAGVILLSHILMPKKGMS